LAQALAILFEPSEILYSKVVPKVSLSPPTTYESLIESAIILILSLPSEDQAQFIAGHPRIGEVSNLSALSAAEQARHATPPEILKRLKELNEAYEKRYPGLVYITFVNGRTRADIVPEMEKATVGDPVEVGGENWLKELKRAVEDVGKIAKSRLGKLTIGPD
jgi:2-oxo-4-hydroxy-4-carboxy--5-ureidoimidazoline (OHCU) decarboxylase